MGGECNRFIQIASRPNNRSANGNSLQDYIEDGRFKIGRRQADNTYGALAPYQREGLRERVRRCRGYKRTVGAAARPCHELRDSIRCPAVDYKISAGSLGEPQFVGSNIDRCNMQTLSFRLLDREMA